jgi:hypothetical protein
VGIPIDAILDELQQHHGPVFAEISPSILP